MSFPPLPSSLAQTAHVGFDRDWPALADALGAPGALGTAALRGEVEPDARGLDVPTHVARIVGHLLVADGADGR